MSSSSESETGIRSSLSARVAHAAAHDSARVDAAIADFFVEDDDRLDDRTRARMRALLAGSVEAIEQAIVAHAARQASIEALPGTYRRLNDSGLLRDHRLGAYLVGAVRLDLMGEALAAGVPQADRSDLLVRLCSVRDGVVASAASALLAAVNRARSDAGEAMPPAVQAQLVWWVAAALQERSPGVEAARALAEAAARCLDAHDPAATTRALAHKLVAAIDPRPEEIGGLLIESLTDARPLLFVAALARSAQVPAADALAMTIDPHAEERLWCVLRALDLDRPTIARIGLLLCEADPRRDLEAFAERLDQIMAIDRAEAANAIAVLRLPAEFRDAQRALSRSARR